MSVTVTCVDDAPVAVDDSATVGEDSGANAIDVLANDTDIDGGPKTISSASDPANGTVVVALDGLSLTYQPDADYFGPDSFTYTLNGGSTATVNVTVTNVNDDPVANDDSTTVAEDSGANAVDVLANDNDGPDVGETLTVTAVTQGANGAVAITGGGTGLSYTPDADFFGTDSFTYTIGDGNGGTATATVNVTVTNVNDAPVVTVSGDFSSVNEGVTRTYTYTITDIDSPSHTVVESCGTGATYIADALANSFACKFIDGPGSSTVNVTANDGGSTNNIDDDPHTVEIVNVKPVVAFAAIAVDPVTGVISSTMAYSDVGVNDTQTATFEYRLNGLLVASHTTTPASSLPSSGTALDSYPAAPGCYSVEVTMWVTDKDGASSDHVVRTGFTALVDIYAASFKAPIKNNERNIAKYGNVVPIKVELASSCFPGTTITTADLYITIAMGNVADVVPDSTPEYIAESVSNADSGTQMRVNGGGYIYNFTTKNLKKGQDYTIRVRLGDPLTGPIILRALFQPK